MSKFKSIFSPEVQEFLSEDEWFIAETEYNGVNNYENESIFTLTSGKMGSRGAHTEGFSQKSLPANYMHGVFDRSEAFQRELVNTPDWAKLKMYVLLEPIALETGNGISEYVRVLDLKNGLTAKHYVHESRDGRKTKIEIVKLLSRKHPNTGAIRYYVTPLNYDGILEFENIIDGTVTNFIDYPRFRVKHLNIRDVYSLDGDGVGVLSETRDYLQALATTAAVRLSDLEGNKVETTRQFRPFGETACEFFDAHLQAGETVVVDKYAAVTAEKDGFDVRKTSRAKLNSAMEDGFTRLVDANKEAYAAMWENADIKLSGDDKMQKALRFNVFHLMSTPNPNDNKTNVGAKLLHGEEYGGHAFWDTELFMLPFFSLVFPDLAKNLVEYRYQMLPGAKRNAIKRGGLGARYPWESADTGDEECPDWTVEYDGTVTPCTVADEEVHVTADVIYGGNQYYTFTGDHEYYENNFLEMLIETSRFWLSRLEWNEDKSHYEITGVTGPDEWHENVANNTFTNYMVKWSLELAETEISKVKAENPELYEDLVRKTNLKDEEIASWGVEAKKIYIPEGDENGLIEQYEGYFDLHDAVITEYDDNNMPLWPKELEQYPKKTTSILKQADVIMLMFLHRDSIDMDVQKENYTYYEARTKHGSSLSPSIHSLMGLYTDNSKLAYEYLERSAYIDLENKNRNTREGLHAAAMGGTWQAVVFGFAGVLFNHNDGKLHINPKLPEQWDKLAFDIHLRGERLHIEIDHEEVVVRSANPGDLSYLVYGVEQKVLPKND